MSPSQLAALAARHARLRWVGAPLLFSGVALVISALLSLGHGGSGSNIALGLFGTGLGLATFGANHDTAMALALLAGDANKPAIKAELAEELARDRAEVMGTRASPRIAMALPLVAILVQGLAMWRIATG